MTSAVCSHNSVICLNEYEIIRKYRCDFCCEIMMCACDERHGRRFLPHQLSEGVDYATKERIPVTIGFQPSVCRDCRGQPPIAFPKAAIHGNTSKIKRFYWRELHFREFDLLAESGASAEEVFHTNDALNRAQLRAKALADIKYLHAANPKYCLDTESEAAFLSRVSVDVIELQATVRPQGEVIREDGTSCSSEVFVAEWLTAQGFAVINCESTPLHTIFAVLLWMLVQDPVDPRVRSVGFGERLSFEQHGQSAEQVWTALPEDFGSAGYARRRASDIDDFFERYLQGDGADLLFAFDLGVEGSYGLRQYLWAHRDANLVAARQLLSVVPPEQMRRALRHLLDDYWRHFLGWPDLFAWSSGKFLFVEVKLSGDKLSDEQRLWIEMNRNRLGFPFKIAKIHKQKEKTRTRRQ